MGAQDGVDILIEAMADLVNRQGRRDIQCAIVGSGTELPNLQRLAAERGLDDFVTFTGFQSGAQLMRLFSTFDIGVIPDPKNGYNDKISMNKHFEYMTLGVPFVQFDLVEGRRIAGDASLYASDNSPRDLAAQMMRLVDDPVLHADLAQRGTERAKALLRWESERTRLLAAYDLALSRGRPALASTTVATASE